MLRMEWKKVIKKGLNRGRKKPPRWDDFQVKEKAEDGYEINCYIYFLEFPNHYEAKDFFEAFKVLGKSRRS